MGEKIVLPMKPFLFTLDQIAGLVNITPKALARQYIHFEYVTVGYQKKGRMLAHNIASVGDDTEWRVSEGELKRWLRYRGFVPYEVPWSVKG